jgi:16S rRNA (cytidine1402-2'-O)-methyltransferase
MSTTLPSGLYIVATPIGNLGDITLRALETLKAASLIACEDTRVTAKLLRAHTISTPMLAYHDHNADQVRPKLLEAARQGAVALVSDAGTPLISDPGYKLVQAARAAGIAVTSLPGACAAIAALTLAGLPTDRFLFLGFLPQGAARRAALREIASVRATLVLYEGPSRTADLLEDIAATLGNRDITVTRELTKLHEEAVSGPAADLAARYAATPPRGEIVVVVAPPAEGSDAPSIDLDAALRAALATRTLKQAVADVTAQTGLPRKQVYARALALA